MFLPHTVAFFRAPRPRGARFAFAAAWMAVALAVAGCRDGASTERADGDVTSQAQQLDGAAPTVEAPLRAPPAPEVKVPSSPQGTGDMRPTVTPERIDAFLAYQGRRLELEKALWADLAAEETQQAPGRRTSRRRATGAAAAPSAAALRRLEQRAEEEAQALEAAGLTPEELESLGTLIREVLGPRQLALELALEETVNLLEEQAERLEGAQQQELLDQVAPLRERLTTLRSLVGVRAAHGDAAVDAVLAREEALLAWQEARLTTLLQEPADREEGQAGGRH